MDIRIYHELRIIGDTKLDQILSILKSMQTSVGLVKEEEKKMANEIENLTTQVALNTSAEQSAVLLLNQLHDLLVRAQNDPAKLTDLITQLGTSKDALAAAIIANTP
jgi:hypothetical protein